MKNLRNSKLSREQLKAISGNGLIIDKNCTYQCCPTDGRPTCPGLMCPDVVCPQY
ncbi:hypothetical protein [Chryseobacterium sp. G0186]|uniref:hypothetical protein n=1 Tax=Chryseobacterium sp. G0186 TaxID=2487064 RepID=UPI0013DDCEC9|nr:hypothetical protein [Chryseobacterium sp. G0186]